MTKKTDLNLERRTFSFSTKLMNKAYFEEWFCYIFGIPNMNSHPVIKYVFDLVYQTYLNRKGYHGLGHIFQMLEGLKQLKQDCQDEWEFKILAFAIIGHDFVYIPLGARNEIKSGRAFYLFWIQCWQSIVHWSQWPNLMPHYKKSGIKVWHCILATFHSSGRIYQLLKDKRYPNGHAATIIQSLDYIGLSYRSRNRQVNEELKREFVDSRPLVDKRNSFTETIKLIKKAQIATNGKDIGFLKCLKIAISEPIVSIEKYNHGRKNFFQKIAKSELILLHPKLKFWNTLAKKNIASILKTWPYFACTQYGH